MERAARLLKDKQLTKGMLTDEDIARAVWPVAVGKLIADHTSRVKLVRRTLVVEVADAIWQKQLFYLTAQIVARVRKAMGSDLVDDIEFRIEIPRRGAQRIERREAVQRPLFPRGGDDAEAIQDPVLKKVYQRSRKKAGGEFI